MRVEINVFARWRPRQGGFQAEGVKSCRVVKMHDINAEQNGRIRRFRMEAIS